MDLLEQAESIQTAAGETAGYTAFSLRAEITCYRGKSWGKMRFFQKILTAIEKANPEIFSHFLD